jgi:hypothetical protein
MSDPRQTTGPDAPEASTEEQAPPPWWDEFESAHANAFRTGAGEHGFPPPPRGFPDLSPLIALVEAMRRVVPVELQDQVNALQRELLLTVRALIDWYLERLDGAQRPTVVEDIPID